VTEPGQPPVVLLHGAGADCARLSWKHVLPRLATSGFPVLAPNLPGHGGTPEPEQPTTAAYLAWLARWLDRTGADRVCLVGLSLGGALALGYTLHHPERVLRVVLVASYGLSYRVPFHGLLRWLVRSRLQGLLAAPPLQGEWGLRLGLRLLVGDFQGVDTELVEDVRRARAAASPGLFWRWLGTELELQRVRTCYRERLGELRCPVLLVHGDRDRLVPLQDAQAASQAIPRGRLVVLRGCGHWPPRERPAEFWAHLGTFLASAERR